MSVIDEEIEVDAPLRETYDQWTQFEEFPVFMEGVEEVRQLDDTRLHWVASIAGVRREWDARITQQIPDQLIAWTSMEGTRNDGLVTFDAVGAHRTHITLRLDLEPDGAIESIGDALVWGLFGDLRVPDPRGARDLGLPAEVGVIELDDGFDAVHEAGELLELGPLVVGGADRDVHVDGFLDGRAHAAAPRVGFPVALPAAAEAQTPSTRSRG